MTTNDTELGRLRMDNLKFNIETAQHTKIATNDRFLNLNYALEYVGYARDYRIKGNWHEFLRCMVALRHRIDRIRECNETIHKLRACRVDLRGLYSKNNEGARVGEAQR